MIVSMRDFFSYRMLLTGTPVTKAKRIHDLYMQWQFLRPETLESLDLRTAEEVKAFTGVWIKKNGYPQWIREQRKNVDLLRRAIHQDSFAIKRSECFDLPPRDEDIIKFDLSRRTAKAYDDMANDMVAEVRELVEVQAELEDLESIEAPSPTVQAKIAKRKRHVHTLEASIRIVQNLRLAQITSGLGMTDEGTLIRIGREKLDLLHDKVEELFEADQKVVIAARFKGDLDGTYRTVKNFKVPAYQLRGGMKRTDSTAAIKAFKEHEGAAAFIMQPQAGSLGIDLSTASQMIWYSLVTSWTDFTQSCDRIALSRNSTTFTYLIAEGTYDEVLLDTLRNDAEVAKMITDKPEIFLRREN